MGVEDPRVPDLIVEPEARRVTSGGGESDELITFGVASPHLDERSEQGLRVRLLLRRPDVDGERAVGERGRFVESGDDLVDHLLGGIFEVVGEIGLLQQQRGVSKGAEPSGIRDRRREAGEREIADASHSGLHDRIADAESPREIGGQHGSERTGAARAASAVKGR